MQFISVLVVVVCVCTVLAGGGSRRSGRRSRIMSDAGTGPPASLPAVSLTGLAGDASNPGSQAVTAQVGMCLMAPGDSNSALPTNLQQTQVRTCAPRTHTHQAFVSSHAHRAFVWRTPLCWAHAHTAAMSGHVWGFDCLFLTGGCALLCVLVYCRASMACPLPTTVLA